jgi:hypothetical protein
LQPSETKTVMSSSNGAVSAGFHILPISVLHRRNGNQSYNAFRHHSLRGPRLLTTRRPAPGSSPRGAGSSTRAVPSVAHDDGVLANAVDARYTVDMVFFSGAEVDDAFDEPHALFPLCRLSRCTDLGSRARERLGGVHMRLG